jgi:sugar phosphate isomerase/epimerase
MTPTRQSETGSFDRRRFLGLLGGAAAATALLGTGSALAGRAPGSARLKECTDVVRRDKLGIQLWTCLGLYEVDMQETLSLLASIGYEFVEYAIGFGSVAGNGGAKAFRKALDDNGLWCNGGHTNGLWPYDAETLKQTIHDALIVGQRDLGFNQGVPTTVAACKKYADGANKAHAMARKMGFKGSLYQHFESADWAPLTDAPQLYAIDVIMKHTTADVWNAQLDTAHSLMPLGSVGKVLRYVRKYPGRFPTYHMKDGTPPVMLPDGSLQPVPLEPVPFGAGDWGRPDIADPNGRPHAGFQDLLGVVRETQNWDEVLLLAEADGTQVSCLDYALPAYRGLNGLRFTYRAKHC